MNLIEEILKLENFHWAWEKAKYFYDKGEYWCDQHEYFSFCINYKDNIDAIIKSIRDNTYKLDKIKPILYPKAKNSNGTRNRQMFWVSIKDQVVWLAVVNVIGRFIDIKIPAWSYGNRLYVNMFPKFEKKEKNVKIHWGYGPYRNTTQNTYRKFNQSWPKFRRDIYLTIKVMSGRKKEISEKELEYIADNYKYREHFKLNYLQEGYWAYQNEEILYWASIDLTQFYPSLDLNNIKATIISHLRSTTNILLNESFEKLISALLDFKIENANFTKKELMSIKIKHQDISYSFNGIPTGLFVAGFLSNVGMLDLDIKIENILKYDDDYKGKIAHFKFVDDQTILSNCPKTILKWLELYEVLLADFLTGAKLNKNKTMPVELKDYLKNKSEKKRIIALEKMKLNPQYPSNFMNQVLEKISLITQQPTDLLDTSEEIQLFSDLKHLLITEFPDEEIRKDTRISFAASRLSIITPELKQDYSNLINDSKKINLLQCKIKDLDDDIDLLSYRQKDQYKIEKKDEQKRRINSEIRILYKNVKFERERLRYEYNNYTDSVFKLLLRSVELYPEKVKLWKNIYSFIFNSGLGDKYLLKPITLLQELVDDEIINVHSKFYIITYICELLNSYIFKSYHYLNSEITFNKRERILNFLRQGLYKSSFYKEFLQIATSKEKKYYYLEKVLTLFRYTLSTYSFILYNKGLIKEEKKEDVEFNTRFAFNHINRMNFKTFTQSEFYYYLAINFGNLYTNKTDPYVWESFIKFSTNNEKELNSIEVLSILNLFFSNSKKKNVKSYLMKCTNYEYINFQWLYNIYGFDIKKSNMRIKNNEFEKLYQYKNRVMKFTTKINLFQYIEILKTRYNENPDDILCSEYFMHRLFGEVIDKLKTQLNKTRDVNFEELNDYIDKNDSIVINFPYNIMLRYDSIESRLKQNDPIKSLKNYVSLEEIDTISSSSDNRYFPSFINLKSTITYDIEDRLLFGIGILMIQMFSRSIELPNYLFLPYNKLLNENILLRRINTLPLSSSTIGLIQALISKRNRETNYLNNLKKQLTFEFDYEDSAIPNIRNLDDLSIQIDKSINNLKECFSNGKQLIPISIDLLKYINTEVDENELY